MKITKSQLEQIIKEEISITELESWASEELEPVINQVLQRLGAVERKLKIDPSTAVIKEGLESTPHVSGDAEVSPRSNARMIQMLYSRLIELEKRVEGGS